jgi:hypothetical protein
MATRAVARRARRVLSGASEQAIRHRPAPGEWAAIEVVGHLIDKTAIWHARVLKVLGEDNPVLDPYDQDAMVRDNDYLHAPVQALHIALARNCEEFARVIETLSAEDFDRPCFQPEYGALSLKDCVVLPLESITSHIAQAAEAIASAGTGVQRPVNS